MALRRRGGDVDVYVVSGPEFRAVADALRHIDRSLPGEFRKEIRRRVKPYVREVKTIVRHLPTPHHAGHTGLRRRVALGVRVRAKVGRYSGVRIISTMPDRGEIGLPRGLDSRSWRALGGGWFHPVFGRPNSRTFQKGYSWFLEPLSNKRDDMRDSLRDQLQQAARYVASHGGTIRP